MSLADNNKPKTLKEIVGQEYAKTFLKKLIKTDDKVKNVILHGEYGTGKTSSAIAFYNDFEKKYPNTSLYTYDSNEVGSKEAIQKIKCYLSDTRSFNKNWTIVIFDEFQEASPESQTSLLKLLEDFDKANILFIFTTTNMKKIIPTIKSRCVSISYKTLSDNEIFDAINSKNIEIPDDVLQLIIEYSDGHLRDVYHKIDQYRINPDNFEEELTSLNKYIVKYLRSGREIQSIKQYSTNEITKELSRVISQLGNKMIDSDFKKWVNLLKLYMELSYYIKNIEDVCNVLRSLRKFFKEK